MNSWLKQVDQWSRQVVILVCILFVTAVGFVDYLTGYETFFFTFYLLAIFLGTWRVSVAFGVLISALSVTAWVSANAEAGAHYANYFIPVWNAAIMFVIYVIIVFLLTLLKRTQQDLEERVRLRTAALSREIQERMRLQKELLETSDREQRRIGQELHDGLCQHLTGTALAGHFLEQKLAARSPGDATEASRLVELIEEGIELTRNLSHQLDPVELKSGKLTDHFEDLAASTSERFKVACHFKCSVAAPPNDAAIATHLYRITQDAVAMAVRHNRAGHIDIGLDSAADEIVLTITDDGAGLPEPCQENASDMDTGWRMAYRADLIGAKFSMEPLATGGTRVTCVLPTSGTHNAAKN